MLHTSPIFPSVLAATEAAPIPAYHQDLLIIKVRSTAPAFASLGMAATFAAEGLRDFPGLSALATLERAGLIKQVTPLARETNLQATGREAIGAASPMSILAATADAVRAAIEAPASATADRNAGVSLVQLELGTDVSNTRMLLASDPSIEYVAPVPIRYILAAPRAGKRVRAATSAKSSDPPPAVAPGATAMAVPPPPSTMWNLKKILWEEARALPNFNDAADIRVAILDTGIDRKHPDLRGRVKSYIFSHPDFPSASSSKDIIGHGTHVAGTIGAKIDNDVGINGICGCQLLSWKIFDDRPDLASGAFVYYVDPVMYQRALADCLDEGVDVINLSIGGPAPPDPNERDLFNELLENGTTIVAAMGNQRQWGSPISYPAAIPGVIAVGATGINDTIASFSNQGNHISLCAPGMAIWSTVPTYPGQSGFSAVADSNGHFVPGVPRRRGTDYDAWPGTSMASPHVAAAAALLLAMHGKMSPADVRERLTKTADKVSAMNGASFDPDYGAGRLNLLRLLQ